jgi:C4-dicarboxylate transporter, DctM subunit
MSTTVPAASGMLFAPRAQPGRALARLRRGEELLAGGVLAAMLALLLVEMTLRPWFGFAIPGSLQFVRVGTLWVALLGAALAAREGRLLALATAGLAGARTRAVLETAAASVGSLVAMSLAVGAVQLVRGELRYGGTTAGLPTWMLQSVLPVAFAAVGSRLVLGVRTRAGRIVAGAGAAAGVVVSVFSQPLHGLPAWPIVALFVAAAAVGAPLFAVLGGLAVFLFMAGGTPPVAVLSAAYELATHPTLPALPVFTLAGFLLAEGDTADRLLRVVRAAFGWVPGGTAIVCVLVCTFFTVFTGGSGVTILALGGLLFATLRRDGYGDRFSIGLLAGSSSLGLLLPPALPIILYAITAEVPIEQLFTGGLLPAALMIALVGIYCTSVAVRSGVPRGSFDRREALAALWHAKWELLLPVVVLTAFFGGYATILETSALTAAYAFALQVGVHRSIRMRGTLPRVFSDSVMTIGGVLVILVVAYGFTTYLVDAEVPERLMTWTRQYIHSPLVFLLVLNLLLLMAGCFMDVFTAILVLAPLVAPLGAEFGVHPVHLGIIFVANLELGYLTPPVGLNLFLASYRFDRPLLEIYRASWPLLVILGIGVVLITYVPWLTTALLGGG